MTSKCRYTTKKDNIKHDDQKAVPLPGQTTRSLIQYFFLSGECMAQFSNGIYMTLMTVPEDLMISSVVFSTVHLEEMPDTLVWAKVLLLSGATGHVSSARNTPAFRHSQKDYREKITSVEMHVQKRIRGEKKREKKRKKKSISRDFKMEIYFFPIFLLGNAWRLLVEITVFSTTFR